MVYRVQDPGLLKAVKAGDKVKFDADRVNNQFHRDQNSED